MNQFHFTYKIALSKLFRDWPIKWIALFTLINGLLVVWSEIVTPYPRYPQMLADFLPFGIYHRSHSITLLFGFFLIYLSYHLYRRKIMAWYLVLICLSYISFVQIALLSPISLPGASLLTLLLLIYFHHYFVVKYDKDNIFHGIKLAIFMLLVAIAVGTAGFWFLDQNAFGIDFHLMEALSRTLREYFLMGNYDLVPHTPSASHFLRLLRSLGMVAFFLSAYSIFRPLYNLKRQAHEQEMALTMTERWGNSSLDYFKLWPNKNYFFDQNHQGFIAFRIAGQVAMALGDPLADKENWRSLTQQFLDYCQRNGWSTAFYCVTDEFKLVCEQAQLKSLRVGQEFFIDLKEFVTVTGKHKDFRRVVRKFEKNNHTFEYLEPPHFPGLMDQLAEISNDWLSLLGRKERNFAVGYFDKEYLLGSKIFVVKDAQDQIIAFANDVKSYKQGEATIDLMRYHKNALNGAMDFLFIKIFDYYLEKGFRTFDLGLSPSSKECALATNGFKEKALQELYRNASIIFSFQGLQNYKQKFKPFTENRYLIYSGNPINMLISAIALTKVSKVKKY